jgi:hypothetical protein
MLDVYGETDPEQQALLLSMVREGNSAASSPHRSPE